MGESEERFSLLANKTMAYEKRSVLNIRAA